MPLEDLSPLDRLQHRALANSLSKWVMSMYNRLRPLPEIRKWSSFAYFPEKDVIAVEHLPIDTLDAYRFLHEVFHAVGYRAHPAPSPEMEELVAFVASAMMIAEHINSSYVFKLTGKRVFGAALDPTVATEIARDRIEWLTGTRPNCRVFQDGPRKLFIIPPGQEK
ncbi:MAG TPA: hypothetical protein PL047_09960, partial [Methanothrix sp.]|nr:hypothetical protein [Methanothrix sp.]